MMKVLLKEDPVEGYILKDIDVPEPVEDEVLIKVEKVTPLELIGEATTARAHCV